MSWCHNWWLIPKDLLNVLISASHDHRRLEQNLRFAGLLKVLRRVLRLFWVWDRCLRFQLRGIWRSKDICLFELAGGSCRMQCCTCSRPKSLIYIFYKCINKCTCWSLLIAGFWSCPPIEVNLEAFWFSAPKLLSSKNGTPKYSR